MKAENEKFWNMPMAYYNGLLLREPLATKMRELMKKQAGQIERLVKQNIDQCEVGSWTHVKVDDVEGIVDFYVKSSVEEKHKRLAIIHEISKVIRTKSEVLSFDSQTEVEEFFNIGEENAEDQNK